MIFGIKKKDNFHPYNLFLAIATNIPQRLKSFVVQGHILIKLNIAILLLWWLSVYIYIKYTTDYNSSRMLEY